MNGTETIIPCPHKEDCLLGFQADGFIVRIWPDERVDRLVYTGGRPLSGTFGKDGRLITTVAGIGLIAVNLTSHQMEILANYAAGRPISFANNLDIDSEGNVYFSDANDVPPPPKSADRYDTLAASLDTVFSGRATGRLLRYGYASRQVTVLGDGFLFANGVALSQDETFVVLAETYGMRLHRYWLTTSKQGTWELFTPHLPGMPDNLSRSPRNTFWVAIPTTPNAAWELSVSFPFVRYLMSFTPAEYIPRSPHTLVAEVDHEGSILRAMHDATGQHFDFVTSVVEHNGQLLLGGLHNQYFAVLTL